MQNQAPVTAAEATKNLKLSMGEHAHWRRELSEKIKGNDLTPEQFIVLSEIPEHGISANNLAEASCVLGPSLSRMLNILDFNGFVRMTHSNKDLREKVITLTRKGKNLVGRVLQ
jgi:DNA-binding MarR family transcriptional regulator